MSFKKLFNSSTFQFCMLLWIPLTIALISQNNITWAEVIEWSDQSLKILMIYAGKEGVVYASEGYANRGQYE